MYSTCTEELASIHVKTVVRKFHILIKDNGWSLLPFGLCLDINSALGNIHTKCSNSPSIPGLDIYSDALHHQAPGSCILHSTWPANHELHLAFLSHSKPKQELLLTDITINSIVGMGLLYLQSMGWQHAVPPSEICYQNILSGDRNPFSLFRDKTHLLKLPWIDSWLCPIQQGIWLGS